MAEESVDLNVLSYKLDELKKGFEKLEGKMDDKLVPRTEFEQRVSRLEKLVYGCVSVILLAFIGFLTSLAFGG